MLFGKIDMRRLRRGDLPDTFTLRDVYRPCWRLLDRGAAETLPSIAPPTAATLGTLLERLAAEVTRKLAAEEADFLLRTFAGPFLDKFYCSHSRTSTDALARRTGF